MDPHPAGRARQNHPGGAGIRGRRPAQLRERPVACHGGQAVRQRLGLVRLLGGERRILVQGGRSVTDKLG